MFNASKKNQEQNLTNNFADNNDYIQICDSQFYYSKSQFLGEGSYGKVYKGYSAKHQKYVAVKIISNPNHTQIYQTLCKEREISFLTKVKSENIVQYIQHIQEKDWCYIITALGKQSLEDYMNSKYQTVKQKNKNQFLKNLLFMYKNITKGVNQIHSHGFIHRDIKLSNILIGSDSSIKIIDFGLCIEINKPSIVENFKVGSQYYMAPEIFQFGQYSFFSDIWSLGVVFYKLLYNQLPLKDEYKEFKQYYAKVTKFRKQIINKFENPQLNLIQRFCLEIILNCLEINKQKRLSSEELIKKIDKYLSSEIYPYTNGQMEMNFKELLEENTNEQQANQIVIQDLISQLCQQIKLVLPKCSYIKGTNQLSSKLTFLIGKLKNNEVQAIFDNSLNQTCKTYLNKIGNIFKRCKTQKQITLYKNQFNIMNLLILFFYIVNSKCLNEVYHKLCEKQNYNAFTLKELKEILCHFKII